MEREDPGPKSAEVISLHESYGEALESDFYAAYGLDLAPFVLGEEEPRKTVNLVRRLPQSSAFKGLLLDRANPESGVGWGEQEFFQALILEQLQKLNYLTETSNSKNPKKVEVPKPVQIPGRKDKKRDSNKFAGTLSSLFEQGRKHLARSD